MNLMLLIWMFIVECMFGFVVYLFIDSVRQKGFSTGSFDDQFGVGITIMFLAGLYFMFDLLHVLPKITITIGG